MTCVETTYSIFEFFQSKENGALFMAIVDNLGQRLTTLISENVPQKNDLWHQKLYLSSLRSILRSYQRIGIKNVELLETISQSVDFPIKNQERFLITLDSFAEFSFGSMSKSQTLQRLNSLIAKNVWNNNLEKLETLDLVLKHVSNEELKLDIGKLRKVTQILVQNSYTLSLRELQHSIKIVLTLAKENTGLFDEYNKFLSQYLLNYAFEDHSVLVASEYQILNKTLNERNIEEQKLSSRMDSRGGMSQELSQMKKIAEHNQVTQKVKELLASRQVEDIYELEEQFQLSKVNLALFTNLKISLQHLNSVCVMLLALQNGVEFGEATQKLAMGSLKHSLSTGDNLTLEHLDVVYAIRDMCRELESQGSEYFKLESGAWDYLEQF